MTAPTFKKDDVAALELAGGEHVRAIRVGDTDRYCNWIYVADDGSPQVVPDWLVLKARKLDVREFPGKGATK